MERHLPAEGSSSSSAWLRRAAEYRGRLVEDVRRAFQFGPLALAAAPTAASRSQPTTPGRRRGAARAGDAQGTDRPPEGAQGHHRGAARWPQGRHGRLREFAAVQPLWPKQPDGSLKNLRRTAVIRANLPERLLRDRRRRAGDAGVPGRHRLG